MADSNPYDSLVDEMMTGQGAAIRNNIYSNVGQSADKAAQIQQLAKTTGLPQQSVAFDPDAAQRTATMLHMDVGKLQTQYPHLAANLESPNFAAIAHDDLPNLAATEQAVKSLPPPSPAAQPQGWLSQIGDTAYAGLQGFAGSFNSAARGLNIVGGAFPTLYDKAASLVTGKDSTAAQDAYFDRFVKPLDDNASYFNLSPNAGVLQKVVHAVGAGAGMFTQVAATGGMGGVAAPASVLGARTAVSSAVEHATKSMAFPALTAAVNTGNDVYQQTGSAAAAVKAATAAYGTNTAMGVLPIGMEGGLLKRLVTGVPVGIATGEANRQVTNAAMPDSMQQPRDISDVIVNGITGAILSGAMGGRGGALESAVRENYGQEVKAAQAEQGMQGLATLSELATGSKLRQRDPDAFKQFIQNVTEDGHLSDVYVDGKLFDDVLNQSGVDRNQLQALMPDVAKQLPTALQTMGDVRIPVADYATHIAGGKLDDALMPHLKTDPDGMTYQQAQDYRTNVQGELVKQAQDLADKQQAQDARDQALQAVYDDRLAQLNSAGRFTDDVNKQYASLHQQLVATLADREGMPIDQVHQMLPLHVQGDGTGDLAQGSQDGPFGPISQDFHHDAPGAIAHLLKNKSGEAVGALHHPEIGDIDLVYGKEGTGESDGYGVAKLAKYHPEVLDKLQDVLSEMKVVQRGTNRVRMESADHKASVRLTWDDQAKNWLLTAFKKKERGVADTRTDTASIGEADDTARRSDASDSIVDQDIQKFYQSRVADQAPSNDGILQRVKNTLRQGMGLLTNAKEAQSPDPLTNPPHKGGSVESGDEPLKQTITAQGDRGYFDPASKTIGLLKDADLSTFLHETGHYWLEAMHEFVQRPEASEGLRGDFDTLLRSFGTQGDTAADRLANWSASDMAARRAGHEQFAEGFERYLLEGKAPTPELQTLFSRFRSWLMNVYRSLTGVGQELSPEVRGVFDRMVASEDAIREAERVRGYLTPDLLGEVTPETQQYQSLGQQATDQAISEMQTRSIRDMKWISNAKSKAMRDLQRTARDERAKIAAEVTKEVMEQPVNKARTWLTKGETVDPNGDAIKAEKGYKLNTDALSELFPKGELGGTTLDGLRGMHAKDGLHPDLVADMFGYNSGRELVHDLLNAPRAKDEIEGMTDQRMLERHGDLVDPVSIERAAEVAIHNDARAKMMATGLKVLTKSPMPVRDIEKAAKAAADVAIAQKKVGDLRPAQYSAAETKANKALLKLAPKDPMGAAQAQRAALLNNRLFKSSTEALADVRSALTYFKRFQRESTLKKIAPEEREQILTELGKYDFRINPSDEPSRAQKNLQQWAESQQQAGYTPIIDQAALQIAPRTQYRSMTVEELRGLRDMIGSIEKIGRDKVTATWRGQRMALADVVGEFVGKMQEHAQKFTPDQLYNAPDKRGIGQIPLAFAKMGAALRATEASLKPQQYKANHFDAHELLGPFHELFNSVFDANYRKIDLTRQQADIARSVADKLGKDWQQSLHNFVDNSTLLDPKLTEESGRPVYMRISRDNLIQMAAHAGSESNFDKLAKGYNWDPATVWGFLDGKLTKEDATAVKTQWEMANHHWEDTKAMYERMGQVVPPKVEARPYRLRLADGTVEDMPGGYMPIRYDPLRSRLGAKQQAERAIDVEAGRFGYDFFGRDTTTNGSMNARNDGYADALDLSHERFERALAETIHDLAYRETLVNVNKIITDSDFRGQFLKTFGRENYDALHTWLGRIANSETVDRQAEGWGKWFRYTRTGMVMNAIALRATTVLKHGGSALFKSAGYFVGGGEKYLLGRMRLLVTDYSNQIASAQEKFSEIRARLLQQDRDYRETVSSLYQPESPRAWAERFGHSAVAWADMMSAVPTAWAAYDRAITEGIPTRMGGTGKPMTEAQAVAYANQMVREAHGSNIESARSNTMSTPHEGVKMFTTLYGFQNNTLGQLLNATSMLKTQGISKPEVLARSMMAVLVPALVAGAVTDGLPKADDWESWLAKATGDEMVSTIPFARDLYSFAMGYHHAGVIGPEAWMQSVAQPLIDGVKAATGHHVTGAIQHIADAAGMGLHIPGLGQLGKMAQYEYDIATGNKPQPADALEHAQGLTVGTHTKH
ncbi:hypothetical protein EAY64_05585 [Aquitalea palustris]|uniref:Large polyvalent protein associated domain-containing protein n=1 Tax=Aquitalea palustris TaxID=2480983 RepID=A0A454JL10_9NEIS|nr:hypothetical protein [Aquitalea palustris]RMD00069.1 hypothetical protein EAY64_05585 [Aquitalea palustris]